MRRLLLLLLAAGVVYAFTGSWSRIGAWSASADSGGRVVVPTELPTTGAGAEPAGLEPASRDLPASEPAAPEATSPAPLHAPGEDTGELLRRVRDGDLETLRRVATELWSGQRADSELAGVFLASAGRLPAGSMLELFGSDNRFLRHPAGRTLAATFASAAAGEPADQGIALSTRWIELAMTGPLPAESEAWPAVERFAAEHHKLVRRTVCNPSDLRRARSHRVESGDVLDRIASRFRREGLKVESGLLMLLNRIDDERRLRAGQMLKIPTDPIRTVIDKSSFLAAVYLGDVILRVYRIGHGKDDLTPEETFVVGEKQEKPAWYFRGRTIPYGHPDNVLGDYFVEFRHASLTGFGAHGTPDPASIGRAESLGCIRMRDPDIAEFFRIVPRGSPITIRSSR